MTRRIAITGAPKAGKTTYSKRRGLDAFEIDSLLKQEPFVSMEKDERWSAISQHVADMMAKPGRLVVEGVQVPRALRKALAERPDVKPVDEVVIVKRAGTHTLTKDQAAMAKGAETVLAKIRPALEKLGVEFKTVVEPDEGG